MRWIPPSFPAFRTKTILSDLRPAILLDGGSLSFTENRVSISTGKKMLYLQNTSDPQELLVPKTGAIPDGDLVFNLFQVF